MPLRLKTLEGVPFERLYEAWCEAFADYAVGLNMGPDRLRTNFEQNGVELVASVGAFEGERLVGFWFNGLRERRGRRWAYDAGTAIVPSHRGKGIARLLAERSGAVLSALGVEEVVLEVLTTNDAAFRMYQKDGFQITRRFACFRRPRPDEGTVSVLTGEGVSLSAFQPAMWAELPEPGYEPSWQNSREAVAAARGTFTIARCTRRGRIVGYGLVQPKRGRIAQLAFLPDVWETALSLAVVEALARCVEAKTVDMVCVDAAHEPTVSLLLAAGFLPFAEQWEMHKVLLSERGSGRDPQAG